MDKLMTGGKLARLLGVAPETVVAWADAGKIPSTRPASWRRYDLDAVCLALGIDPKAIGTDGGEPAPPLGGRAATAKPEPTKKKPGVERRGRKPDPDREQFNQTLHSVMHGDLHIGDLAACMTILTGLTYNEIRSRIDTVEYEYSDDEKASRADELASNDLKTLIPRYSKSTDPEVQAWVASIRRPANPTAKSKNCKPDILQI